MLQEREIYYYHNATHYKVLNFSAPAEVEQYVGRHLGPRHLPLSTIVPISAVYAAIFVVGVLGNASTCLVIWRNKYMQTPTNVYLANLAVSDLLTHLVGEWGEFICLVCSGEMVIDGGAYV